MEDGRRGRGALTPNNRHMKPALLFVIGASGAGKTAAVQALDARALPGVQCHHLNSIDVPPTEIMERDFGTGERWQAHATAHWVERLAANRDAANIAVLDGQTRPSFIRAALARTGVRHARIVLLDCDPRVRAARLAGPRGQPELVTQGMDAWAAYLRGQADALGLPVVDTAHRSIDAVADALQEQLELLRAEAAAEQALEAGGR